MHHYTVPQDFCPMKAMAERTHHIYVVATKYASLPIRYIDKTNKHVTTANITLSFRESLVLSRLMNSGYSLLCFSAPSLRASGAMALRLNDVGE